MKTEAQEIVNAATERNSNLHGATNKLEANLHHLGMRREKSSYFSKKMLTRAFSARCAPLEVTLKRD